MLTLFVYRPSLPINPVMLMVVERSDVASCRSQRHENADFTILDLQDLDRILLTTNVILRRTEVLIYLS